MREPLGAPSVCPPASGPHLSAGAHRGEGVGPTQEHFPAGDNQDSHVVLTLLLKHGKVREGQALQMQRWGSFLHTTAPHTFRASPSAPDPPCSKVQVAPADIRPHNPSLPGRLSTSLPTQMLGAASSPAPGGPCSLAAPLIQAASSPHGAPPSQKPQASYPPGPWTTKATYLSLPFALAGAACVLVGGPLCGLWEEHTDITRLCHSLLGQAAARGLSGQEAGEGQQQPSGYTFLSLNPRGTRRLLHHLTRDL